MPIVGQEISMTRQANEKVLELLEQPEKLDGFSVDY